MRIIEIEALENGAHRNQASDSIQKIPDGWAKIPGDMIVPDTFPFVNIEVKGKVVVSMTAGVIPEPEPEPEPAPSVDERITELEAMNAELEDAMCEMDAVNQAEIAELQETTAYLEDALCEMDAANEERMAAIEDALCEMDMG